MELLLENYIKLLFKIAQMHEDGYEGLRIMPLLQKGKWGVFIAPRSYFSEKDGAYIPIHLRAECIYFSPDSNKDTLETSIFKTLEHLYPRRTSLLFSEWISLAEVPDQLYKMWFLALLGRCMLRTDTIPVKHDLNPDLVPRVLFSLADLSHGSNDSNPHFQNWVSPPPGQAELVRNLGSVDPDTQVAQKRQGDLSKLNWGYANKKSDSALDNWYDDHAPNTRD